jgi:hypothetical protein
VKCHKGFAIFLISLGLPSWAQNGHSIPAAPIGPELPYTEVLTPPAPVNMVQLPITFSPEGERSNILSGSVQVGSGYNDNALVTPTNPIGNFGGFIVPRIELRQERERLSLDLAYSPGITINRDLPQQNQFAHDLAFFANYRISPHVSLQFRDNFAKVNNLFGGLFGGTIGPGPLQQSNSSVITPLADSTANNGGLGLTYQFSLNSLVGISGNYDFVNYGAVENTRVATAFIDSRSASGAAFYAHRFSNRHWLGANYQFQQFMFVPGGRTTVHRAIGFYTLALTPSMTLSLWAGPQYSTTYSSAVGLGQNGSDTLAWPARWSPASGVVYDWQGKRGALRAGYTRQISDGGGLAEAVSRQQFDAEIRRSLSARWTATLESMYSRNDPLQTLPSSMPLRSFLGNTGIEYRITQNLGASLRYGRQQQRYGFPLQPSNLAKQNRLWFSFTYSFNRPFGR